MVVKNIIEFLVTLMALPPEYVPKNEPLAGRQVRAFLLALMKMLGSYLLGNISQDEFLDAFRRLRYQLERPTQYIFGNDPDYFNQVIITLLDPDKLYFDLGYKSDMVITKNFAIRLASEAWQHPKFLEFIHDVARKDRLEKAADDPDYVYRAMDVISDPYTEFPSTNGLQF